MEGNQYLLPIISPIPAGVDCNGLADQVFARMAQDDAINDLSLPDPTKYPWAQPVATVRVVFKLYDDDADVPLCVTLGDVAADEIICHINYTLHEHTECGDIIDARVAHELTHAIRRTLVRDTIILNAIPDDKFSFTTPPKKFAKRKFKSAHLYMMDNLDHSFHSGYWMEHKLYGGVTIGLTGSYFTDINNPAASRVIFTVQEYFKVIKANSKTTKFNLLHTKLTGYWYNRETKTFGAETSIFHAGTIITRCCGA